MDEGSLDKLTGVLEKVNTEFEREKLNYDLAFTKRLADETKEDEARTGCQKLFVSIIYPTMKEFGLKIKEYGHNYRIEESDNYDKNSRKNLLKLKFTLIPTNPSQEVHGMYTNPEVSFTCLPNDNSMRITCNLTEMIKKLKSHGDVIHLSNLGTLKVNEILTNF
ncbi:hypothetical protein [Methanospirillum lacunae]|uniref:Uncharacterized protein n=1 Tax=Methanospirillum lacunae TaxID=668570 RepID=A0A2V2N537_9EURY|nr:hypothetical protein [Methanospirillum lacunae]PWR73710.1 hypothetical protein DK846_00625 [Methanospirillum lacunae]